MDFDRKEFTMNKISQNGGMVQQMMMLAQIADNALGTGGELAAGIAQQYGMNIPSAGGAGNTENMDALGGDGNVGESSITKNARKKTAQLTSPT